MKCIHKVIQYMHNVRQARHHKLLFIKKKITSHQQMLNL